MSDMVLPDLKVSSARWLLQTLCIGDGPVRKAQPVIDTGGRTLDMHALQMTRRSVAKPFATMQKGKIVGYDDVTGHPAMCIKVPVAMKPPVQQMLEAGNLRRIQAMEFQVVSVEEHPASDAGSL
jgi:hypothetical protein